MSTETDHAHTGTEAEADNGWTEYTHPAQDEPPEHYSGDPEAVVVAEVEVPQEQDSPGEPESAEEAAQEAVATPVEPRSSDGPLLSAEAESDMLSRWNAIQMSFVEDPHASVQDADALVQEIGDALLASFNARKSELAAGWQHGQPDTEELRLALRQYRSFIGVVLPA